MPKKTLKGRVVSDKMKKTVIVEVERLVYHPKYKKRYFVSKKYKVHDAKSECEEGEEVVIKESKPLSKDKRWTVMKKMK